MIQIKKTKSVIMFGDEDQISINILNDKVISIPMKSVFQVIRGLISYTQKFYRKKVKDEKHLYQTGMDDTTT